MDDIENEIQQYILENRESNQNEEDSNTNSLETIYILSDELSAIVGKQECSGKEVFALLVLIIRNRYCILFGNMSMNIICIIRLILQ